MFKNFLLFFLICLNISFAKDISVSVLAQPEDLTSEMNEEQLLSLNGYRQTITSELIELNLDSELFWSKLDERKMSSKEELIFLKSLFENDSLNITPAITPAADPKTQLP